MGYEQVIQLPERTIGRAGRDLTLSDKDVTVIMVPYERYSVFPKAVDELFKNTNIPFNLIVIEGNAPEDVRVALEKRQRRHGNMTILYTNYSPMLANAFNLALPHVKTPYALCIDNETRLPKGTLERMLLAAKDAKAAVVTPKDGILPRRVRTRNADGREIVQSVKTFGLRPCFLISQEAVRGTTKFFDEASSPYSFGVDLAFKLRAKNLKVVEDGEAKVEMRIDSAPGFDDLPLFTGQWNYKRFCRSLEQLHSVWGVHLVEDAAYESWLQTKMKHAEGPAFAGDSFFPFVTRRLKRLQEAVVHLLPVGWAKNAYPTKATNVSQ